MKLSILDYGVSNLKSVKKAFEFLNCDVTIISDAQSISSSDIIIFPGQGAFGQSTRHLNDLNLTQALRTHIEKQKPFFGICLGFQLLFQGSEEASDQTGLSIFPGHFKKFKTDMKASETTFLKVPQMGWNTLDASKNSQLLANLPPQPYVYFVHSYYIDQTTPSIVSSTTTYGLPYISSIQADHVWGTQFHPEKSGDTGLQILKNFISFCKA